VGRANFTRLPKIVIDTASGLFDGGEDLRAAPGVEPAGEAMTRLRQECFARGKGLVFDIFRAFVGIARIFHFFPQR